MKVGGWIFLVNKGQKQSEHQLHATLNPCNLDISLVNSEIRSMKFLTE
jgi:hypothetical protein